MGAPKGKVLDDFQANIGQELLFAHSSCPESFRSTMLGDGMFYSWVEMWTLGIWKVKSAHDTGHNFIDKYNVTSLKMAAVASTSQFELEYCDVFCMTFATSQL